MKQIIRGCLVLIVIFTFHASSNAQTRNGYIITNQNEKIESSLKLEKGKLISDNGNGKSRAYVPAEVRSFAIDTSNYISYSNDFYKETISGPKATLYQKVSDNSGQKMYNGAEVVGFVQTSEGRTGDYYVQIANESKLDHISKKNFRNYFSRLFSNNDSVSVKLKNDEIGYDQVKELVILYNNEQDTAAH